jgi:hypothetical protein
VADPLGQDRPHLAVVERVVLDAPPADPYLSLAALAAYSGLSVRTLRTFLHRNPPAQALPCFRLGGTTGKDGKIRGGKILVRRSVFDAYMERFRSQGRPALVRTLRRLGLETT